MGSFSCCRITGKQEIKQEDTHFYFPAWPRDESRNRKVAAGKWQIGLLIFLPKVAMQIDPSRERTLKESEIEAFSYK